MRGMQDNPFSVPLTFSPFPLILRGVGYARGEAAVLSGVDLVVEAGGLNVLRGANGAGKTTLLHLLAGLIRPSAGVATWADGARPAQVPERAVLIGHQDALKPALTVAENLNFWSRFCGLAENPWPRGSDPFAVWAHADVAARALSAGQKRRVALTRLAFSASPLWLLDEPGTALDAGARRIVWELVAAHRRRGGAVAVAMHGDATPADAVEITLGGGG
jgi:heme exporter protein A